MSCSSEIPALAPFFLDFTWTSLGGENVHDVVTVEVQAAQSHEWSVLAINATSVIEHPVKRWSSGSTSPTLATLLMH